MQKDLQDYRKSYEQSELLENKLAKEPIELFGSWFLEAENHPGIAEVNAMNLSTIGEDGFPKARVVLLKSFSREGFTFYTNYSSEKGRALELHNKVCLSFFWPGLERQVIIKGMASKTSKENSEDYFKIRPRGSQIGAWASSQSEVIESREALEEQLQKYEEKFKGQDIPKPPYWGGYLVKPESFEFWQGRLNRLHDRILYTSSENKSWKIQRLAP
ncbi:MAG: pyridoxamine 5'-phosphate oxidase [Salegentibacter sp.]